jgi:hypothetical protein
VNLMGRAVQQIGLGPLSSQWREMYARGGAQRDVALARATIGAITAGVIAHMYGAGLVTGRGPQSPELKKIWTEEGHQPNALELGGGTYDVGNLPEPTGAMIGMVANTAEVAGALPADDGSDPEVSTLHQRLSTAANAVTLTAAEQLHNESFFKTLSALVNVVAAADRNSAQGDNAEKAYQALLKLTGSLVPTEMSDVAHGLDPVRRRVDGELDSIRAATPGLSKDLPPLRDYWGNPATVPLGSAGFSLDLLSTPKYTGINHDPASDELLRLNIEPPAVPKMIEGAPLTPKQQDRFAVIRGGMARALMQEVLHTPDYQDANDNLKRELLHDVIASAQEAARGQLIGEDSALQSNIGKQAAAKAARFTAP